MMTFLLRSIRHNFWYKLLCVFLAVVLHFYAAGLINAHPSHLLTLPLTARNLPPNLILDEKSISSAHAHAGWAAGRDQPFDRYYRRRLGGPVPFARPAKRPLLPVHVVGLPSDVTVESDPAPVTLMLQPRRRRQMLIRVPTMSGSRRPVMRLRRRSSRRARPSLPERARPWLPWRGWWRRPTQARRPARWMTTLPSSPWMPAAVLSAMSP